MVTVHPQYIVDNNGEKSLVVIPAFEFKSIMEELEELEDLRLYDESKNDGEPLIDKNMAMEMIQAERKKLGK